MRAPLRLLTLALFVLLLAGGGHAQQQPASPENPAGDPQEQPIFRAGINYVSVDVIVTDRNGNPVVDLSPEDFQIAENGRPQTVESFQLIQFSRAAALEGEPREIRTTFDEEAEAAREGVRLFAIFLDDYHVRRGSALGVREPLINFIRTQLLPSDMLAVMYPLTPLSEVRMTRNHGAVIREIEQFDGRKYDYTPRNQFEEQYARYPAAIVERIRMEVSFSALKALVTRLGGLREGRKSVILVSEGYSGMLPPQLQDPIASLPGVGNPFRHDPMAGEHDQNLVVRQAFSQADVMSELREVYGAANRNNTAIYALDPRGLATSEFDITQNVGPRLDQQILQASLDTLRILSDQTDGRAIVSRNNLEDGLRQVVNDLSAYYLLGYNSTEAPSDGRFHEIRVRVNRPGVQVRARRGYWALTAEESARALAEPTPGPPAAVEAALASIVQPPRGRVVRTWIGTSAADNGRVRVRFVWEPLPTVPGVRQEAPARVSLTALAADGSPVFRGRVPDGAAASAPLDSRGTSAQGQASGGPSQIVFDVEPGPLQLRVAVEGEAGEILDSDVTEVPIPDLTAQTLVLSTPLVFRSRTVRERQDLMADPDPVPTAIREFRRTERLLIRFEAYGEGSAAAAATARLLNRNGDPMVDLPVTPTQLGPGIHEIDVPLAGLAPGEYLIEMKAAVGGTDASELVAFRVIS